MPCHQHRCCRRPATRPAPDATPARDAAANPTTGAGAAVLDYVLLAGDDPTLTERAAAMLRSAGLSVEPHDLGLRLNTRGVNWTEPLCRLSDVLPTGARRALHVATIPVSDDAVTFHKALLASRPLDAFAQSLTALRGSSTASADTHLLGDVFKGESLE